MFSRRWEGEIYKTRNKTKNYFLGVFPYVKNNPIFQVTGVQNKFIHSVSDQISPVQVILGTHYYITSNKKQGMHGKGGRGGSNKSLDDKSQKASLKEDP